MKNILKNIITIFKDDEKKEKMINDYDYIIDIIDGKYNILEQDGNFLEIGSFFGLGTAKLAEYLKYGHKKLISVDCFDLKHDDTLRNDGRIIRSIYMKVCDGDEFKKQYEMYRENTSGFNNIITIKKNTKFVEKEMMMVDEIKNAFIIVDGSKNSKIFRLDLLKAWEIVGFNGVICIPDYYTKRDKKYLYNHVNNYVDDLIKSNKDSIGKVIISDEHNIIFIQKIERKRGRPKLKEV